MWNEAQNVTLASAVTIDASAPGLYTSSLSFAFGAVGAGSVVSSQFIHFNTVGSSSFCSAAMISAETYWMGMKGFVPSALRSSVWCGRSESNRHSLAETGV